MQQQQQQQQQQLQQQHQQQQHQPSANNMSYPPAVNNNMPGDAHIKAEPGVKIEPGTEQTGANPQAQTAPNEIVQQRLAANLRNQFGERASDTIKNLQAGEMRHAAHPQHPGQQRPMGQPTTQAQQQANAQAQYRQQVAASTAQQVQAAQNGQGQYPPQMDGTAEEQPYSGVLMQRGADGETTELGRVEIDRMLHAAIEAKAKSMEGGGLMLPLKRATKKHGSSQQMSSAGSGPSRFDGGDDEEDDDEAINSDLDDSDDNGDEEDDDEDGGQIMLCMYDKVQRVKNKWYVSTLLWSRLVVLTVLQEVRSERWCSQRQRQGLRLPQGHWRV